MNKGLLFGILGLGLALGHFRLSFADEVTVPSREVFDEKDLRQDPLQAQLVENQGVFYAVAAVDKTEGYKNMCKNGRVEPSAGVEEGYQGNEGLCGALLARDALNSLQSMLARYKCSDPSGGSIGFSIAHTSFYPDASKAPLVLAQSTQVTCEESPGASPKGVYSTKRDGWEKQCADRDCYGAFWGTKYNRVYLLLPVPLMVQPGGIIRNIPARGE